MLPTANACGTIKYYSAIRMVPEYHPVFADTRLVYRLITLEVGLGKLQDLQEDQWATLTNLVERVETLTN